MSTTEAPQRPEPGAAPRIPRGWAALVGVLSVAAALAAGQLVAGLLSPASSPYLAVGDTVIRFSPQWLTEFAKAAFGTADKPVLLAGMAVVIAVVAALAGLASRRRPGPGVVVVAVLGVLGFVAVLFAPVFAPVDVLAPTAALVVGVGVFRWLHARALPSTAGPAEASGGLTRRALLVRSSLAVALGSAAAGVGGVLLGRGVGDSRQAVTARLAALPVDRAPAIPPTAALPELGTPTFLTPNADFYRIDVALRIPDETADAWSMRIHGMVENELELTFDDLLRRPLVERTITMTCVSNPVGGDLISTANFVGVDLRELLLEAGVRPGADQAFSTSVDGWYTGTPVDVLMEPDRGALLAIGMNGEALPPEHGFPVRMVVPGLYGFVSATKWIVDMELTTFAAKAGYWLERGWAEKAPIKTQSRIDSPRGFASLPAGRVTVAGIAWSQPDGISRVEVRVDGGAWREAELATEVSGDTWRMWRADLDLGPGSHTVQSRATDANGVTQTDVPAEPIPDGASGYPAVLFSVA
ncbi:molybdopterin-dependent oxidoreductase [Pseudonocardia kunmingensis]|uniref:molybdopterin-dependent oxidoreductase n=1 Tax=Pseudonocardia kunmingensis TaxID=630975 RepID=UPI001FE73FF7|nr:molybdopterin-dependent oxidoreductase [Pseudonocardia kunmingensis]